MLSISLFFLANKIFPFQVRYMSKNLDSNKIRVIRSLALLPNLFYLPLLNHSFLHPQKFYIHTLITDTSITRYKYEGIVSKIYFCQIGDYFIITNLYIFSMNLLQSQMFNFIQVYKHQTRL